MEHVAGRLRHCGRAPPRASNFPLPVRGPSSTGKFDGLKPQQFQTFSCVELRRRTFPAQVRRVSSTVLNLSNFKRFQASNLGVELPVYKDREKFDAFSLPLDLRI